MKPISMQKLREEPINSGIIMGFLTLCAIAFVNLVGNLFSGSGSLSATLLFVLAIVVSILTGAAATLRSKKSMLRRQIEVRYARSLAAGDFSNSVWHGDDGHTELAVALTDIADRQLAIERNNGQLIQEAATRESQLLSALDCVGQEIAVFDKSGLLACANTAYLSYCNTIGAVVSLGMTKREVWAELAKAPRAGLPLNERHSWFKLQEEMRHEATTAKTPVRFTRFNGDAAQMSVHTTKEGHQVEIIETIENLMNLEQRVQKAEREASAMSRLKQVTLSRLSHTIRTPMTGVLAAAELLSESQLDSKQRGRLDIIRRSAGTLLGVVQDMFELADATTANMDVDTLIEVPKRKHALVCSTPLHLAQATCEMLSKDNFDVTTFEPFAKDVGAADAWKLAQEKIAALIVLADDVQKNAMLAVANGNDPANGPELKLFSELLEQTENPDADVDDEVIEYSEPSVPEIAKSSELLDLLVVESNEVNQIYLSNSLQFTDFDFRIVGTGALAIEAAKTGKPRLILLDISIPDIDGLKVTATIRNATASDANAPVIIGMSNHFVQGDLAKCLKAGMDHYMAKPQTAERLRAVIDDWLKPAELKKAG